MSLSAQVAVAVLLAVCLFEADASPTTRSTKCEQGWTYLESTHKCYKLFKEHVLWSEGAINCRYEGGDHVAVHSEEENKFVQTMAAGEDPIWLGFAIFNGKYREWSDLAQSSYTNWFDGKNPPFDHAQMCTKMQEDGKWHISCCKKPAGYICMKKAE